MRLARLFVFILILPLGVCSSLNTSKAPAIPVLSHTNSLTIITDRPYAYVYVDAIVVSTYGAFHKAVKIRVNDTYTKLTLEDLYGRYLSVYVRYAVIISVFSYETIVEERHIDQSYTFYDGGFVGELHGYLYDSVSLQAYGRTPLGLLIPLPGKLTIHIANEYEGPIPTAVYDAVSGIKIKVLAIGVLREDHIHLTSVNVYTVRVEGEDHKVEICIASYSYPEDPGINRPVKWYDNTARITISYAREYDGELMGGLEKYVYVEDVSIGDGVYINATLTLDVSLYRAYIKRVYSIEGYKYVTLVGTPHEEEGRLKEIHINGPGVSVRIDGFVGAVFIEVEHGEVSLTVVGVRTINQGPTYSVYHSRLGEGVYSVYVDGIVAVKNYEAPIVPYPI